MIALVVFTLLWLFLDGSTMSSLQVLEMKISDMDDSAYITISIPYADVPACKKIIESGNPKLSGSITYKHGRVEQRIDEWLKSGNSFLIKFEEDDSFYIYKQ